MFFFQTFIACCLFEPLGLMVMNLYRYLWLIPKYIGQDNMMESAAGWVDSGDVLESKEKIMNLSEHGFAGVKGWF